MKISKLIACGLACTLISSTSLFAKASKADLAKLGGELTSYGAIQAGNKAGTIPAWTGGITKAPAGYKKGDNHIDPYKSDKPLYTITPDNVDKYKDLLSPGQIAMFTRYPKTYKIVVYPSHRSASFPKFVYDAAENNAANSVLTKDTNGVLNAGVTVPFPIPNNGVEAIWNHLLRYRGEQLERKVGQASPTSKGSYVMVTIKENVYFPYNVEGATVKSVKNKPAYFVQTVTAPPRRAGNILLVHDTLNQTKEPRLAWSYNPGQRRVRRAPNIAYDTPGTASDGQRTTDQSDIFNGSPNRYNWELVGRKEMLVPYNSYKLHSKDVEPKDIIQAGHINQDISRYELHRVWEVKGTLKKGTNHIFASKTYYLDEDSWQILVADQYDSRGNIWRVSEAHCINYYEKPVFWDTLQLHYDLQNGRYLAFGFNNQGPVDNFDVRLSKKDFTPQKLRRKGRR
ncbi:MAG: DUF1329 domain-containing protein [Candidatus Cloacimonetes bacterium]|nr:DUF1329 domain-containing protein [Candidatus Cloacimonadota bacterium]